MDMKNIWKLMAIVAIFTGLSACKKERLLPTFPADVPLLGPIGPCGHLSAFILVLPFFKGKLSVSDCPG